MYPLVGSHTLDASPGIINPQSEDWTVLHTKKMVCKCIKRAYYVHPAHLGPGGVALRGQMSLPECASLSFSSSSNLVRLSSQG